MYTSNRKLWMAQLAHFATFVYNKTFFNVSSLAKHMFFELFQFHLIHLFQKKWNKFTPLFHNKPLVCPVPMLLFLLLLTKESKWFMWKERVIPSLHRSRKTNCEIDKHLNSNAHSNSLICLNDQRMSVQGVTDLIGHFDRDIVGTVVGSNITAEGEKKVYNVPPKVPWSFYVGMAEVKLDLTPKEHCISLFKSIILLSLSWWKPRLM